MQQPGASLEGGGDPGPLSEDCLTLNVWTPAAGGGAKKPVMVWIHGGALVFGAALALLAALLWTRVSRVFLFWAAFILTRPLGATVGDFLDKPLTKGGLELSRVGASLVLGIAIVGLILMTRQKAAPVRPELEA